jgi:Zn-dependent protease with chaperone function
MGEKALFAGLFGRDQTLVLGLGLLILLDRPAVEAVLEHEFAHADRKHSSGLTRIHEFLMTYESFHGYVEDDLPMVDLFLETVLTSFAAWLHKEYLRRSKIHEIEADRQSAERVGVETEGRAQVILEGSIHLAEKLIFDPLDKELRGALVAPMPPLDRIIEKRAELTDLGNIKRAVKEVLLKKADPDADHPPLEDRLAAIGAKHDMAIEPVGPPAFQTMLPEETRERLLRELNKEWLKAIDDYVRLE